MSKSSVFRPPRVGLDIQVGIRALWYLIFIIGNENTTTLLLQLAKIVPSISEKK